VSEQPTLLWQLGVSRSLLDVVVAGLSEQEAFQPPAPGAWSVRRAVDGSWHADWADAEPDPAPATTVAWLLWHIGWWWSDVTQRAFGAGPVTREQASWPGSVEAALTRIADCHSQWTAGVAGASAEDLASVEFGNRCWPLTGLPFLRVVAWVNGELMKNAAEIGATRRILSGTAVAGQGRG
jgi:hypothetical protein